MITPQLTPQEKEAILSLCWLAATVDGKGSELEQNELRRISRSLDSSEVSLDEIGKRTHAAEAKSATFAEPLSSPAARELGYQSALCTCYADRELSKDERAFLDDLVITLQIPGATATALETQIKKLALAPLTVFSPSSSTKDSVGKMEMDVSPNANRLNSAALAEVDQLIQSRAVLCGALELLPDSLAHLAIVPIQLRLVYTIGKRCGYELDRGHILELAATAGMTMTSQFVETYARKLLSVLAGTLLGGVGRAAGNQAASSGLAFATTYAMGQLAKRYYGGGRVLSAFQLKETFQTLVTEARGLHQKFLGEIQTKATEVKPAQIQALVQQ